MSINQLVIFGAGGHARVVIDAARLQYPNIDIVIADDNLNLMGFSVDNAQVFAPIEKHLPDFPNYAHIAIGNNQVRERLLKIILNYQKQFTTIIHPRAMVAPAAQIADGCFIAGNAIIAPGANIGRGTIINHGAVIDHDCQIGAWVHVAPNATLGGNVKMGSHCLIGAGAIILPNITIGDGVVIGAGAVVTKDLSSHQTVKGMPAK